MEKILFACDLDGTLIHSHKRRRADDICVEIYDKHEQSFIAPRAFDLLREISERVIFVPVTTRSIAQYRRIFWTENFRPTFAVVANGAYFLDGDRQENFLRDEVSPFADELEIQHEKFFADERFNICRVVDESFLFLRRADDFDGEIFFDTRLTVQQTGKKIYLFPPPLNKGNALKRLVEKFSPTKIFAAGDTEIDLPMLNLADRAFAPQSLGGKFSDAPNFAAEFLLQTFEEVFS